MDNEELHFVRLSKYEFIPIENKILTDPQIDIFTFGVYAAIKYLNQTETSVFEIFNYFPEESKSKINEVVGVLLDLGYLEEANDGSETDEQ